jgi:hypothetical protein
MRGFRVVAALILVGSCVSRPEPSPPPPPPPPPVAYYQTPQVRHAAHIVTEGEDLPAMVTREGVRAHLRYMLQSNFRDADVVSPASRALLAALREGDSVEVRFRCSPCAPEDNQQPYVPITLDKEIVFPFMPTEADAAQVSTRMPAHAILLFRSNGRMVDRWAIPFRVLEPGEPSDDVGGAMGDELRPWSGAGGDPAPDGEPIVMLDYYNLDGQLQVRLTLPPELIGYYPYATSESVVSRPLREDMRTTGGRNRAESAINELNNEVGSAVDRLLRTVPTRTYSARLADEIDRQAHRLREHLFPGRIRQLLFNLARCRTTSDQSRPIVALHVRGLPYAPLQLLPVQNEGDPQLRCSEGLVERSPLAAEGDVDDFLGLHIAVASRPTNTELMSPFSTEVGDFWQSPRTRVVGGVYQDRPLVGEDEISLELRDPNAAYFDQLASTLEGEAILARDGLTFLQYVREQRNETSFIVVNTHGQRRLPNGRELPAADRLIFSNSSDFFYSTSAHVPDGASVDADEIVHAFRDLIDANPGERPLVRRPVVLLLACETAPYRPQEVTLPYAFFQLGASAVVATEVKVPGDFALRFGEAAIPRLRSGTRPEIVVHQVQRELFAERDGVYALLWAAILADSEP